MSGLSQVNIEDHAELLAYLRASRRLEPGETPGFENLRGGVSNRAVWLRRAGGADWVLKQALGKLRVQVDWFSAPERIIREAEGLRWLGRIIPCHVPELIFLDPAQNILAMTCVPQPHKNWKSLLLNGRGSMQHARSFGRLLARIHNAATQHPELAHEFAERRFFEELRLEPYYGYTARQTPAAARFLKQLTDDTRLRQHALVHGDYSPKNVLIRGDGLTILDFEVIHFGDPAFDIGFSLTHFLSKAHYMPTHREVFLEMARHYWQSYSAELTAPLRDIMRLYALRHTLACCLARVAGRSPLEYLDAGQRERQKRIVLDLLPRDMVDVPQLIRAFGDRLAYDDV